MPPLTWATALQKAKPEMGRIRTRRRLVTQDQDLGGRGARGQGGESVARPTGAGRPGNCSAPESLLLRRCQRRARQEISLNWSREDLGYV